MQITTNYSVSRNAFPQKQAPTFKRNWAEHISWGANYLQKESKANFKLFTFPDAKKVFVEVASKAGENMGNIMERVVKVVGTVGGCFVATEILPKDNSTNIYPMENLGDGVFEAKGVPAQENAEYRYIIQKTDTDIKLAKDPYAKKQNSINGWSQIYNSENYNWKNTDWLNGSDPRRITRNPQAKDRGIGKLIIEEVCIPTLSQEGTFEKAKKYIKNIADRKIANAIELMPVENTFSLQWGYDGVDKFAVNEKMGGAKKLKELIDYAHGKGLNVIMDMVPNHIGPDGNYLSQTGPYEGGNSDFGSQFNYEGPNNRYVRDWMTNAALWWVNEFKVDGLRLDMTKFCKSDYLLKQVVDEVNHHNPGIFLIAEDGRNNKNTVTAYNPYEMPHEEDLKMIDESVKNIEQFKWHTYPNEIGFDSEWDFPFMHELKEMVLSPFDRGSLFRLDDKIKSSQHRIKYLLSHDEIGNIDGTRLIPKVITNELNLYGRVSGSNDAEIGQKAAHLGQYLAELCATEDVDNISKEELHRNAKKHGLDEKAHISHNQLIKAFNIAKAKQKLAMGTIFTIPGPKMYFQGDDVQDLSYFKFFREFSSDEGHRKAHPEYIEGIIREKGYDTLETTARKDSIIASLNYKENSEVRGKFAKDLAELFRKEQVLQYGDIVETYCDTNNKVHIHRLHYNGEELLIIKNFGGDFFSHDYGYNNFPSGNWKEIFNSDMQIYGGSNFVNTSRMASINSANQNINLAPNSIIILKKV